MTDSPDNRPDGATATRAGRREDRRARVGILPNPHSAPPPPPRKVSLMGRWPSLRSSRRRPPGDITPAAPAPRAARGGSRPGPVAAGTTAALVHHAPDGGIRVDLERLDAAIRDLDGPRAGRSPYAARFRADQCDAPLQTADHAARARPTAEAAPAPAPDTPAPSAPPAPAPTARPAPPPGRRRAARLLLGAGLALAVALTLLALTR